MGYNVLIVDDSATTRAVIKRIISLAQLPAELVLEAPDGQAALDVMGCQKVDVVLADVNMPVMGGLEMTRQMATRDGTRGIPVVVISANPGAVGLDQIKNSGIKGFLRKPFSPEDLRGLLTRLMEAGHV